MQGPVGAENPGCSSHAACQWAEGRRVAHAVSSRQVQQESETLGVALTLHANVHEAGSCTVYNDSRNS
eukprot:353005-Chlamydomonas_euryale.AAC.2